MRYKYLLKIDSF